MKRHSLIDLFISFVVVLSLLPISLLQAPQVFASPLPVPTVTLQPGPGLNNGTDNGTASAGKDTFDWQPYPAANYGNLEYGYLFNSNCNDNNGKTYVRFDLNGLPASNIVRATASIYVKVYFNGSGSPWSQGNLQFSTRKITSDWNEMSLDWSNHPSLDSIQISQQTIAISGGTTWPATEYQGWLNFDITELYRGWTGGSINNYGIAFAADTSICVNGDMILIVTSDSADSTLRPKLAVEYNPAASLSVHSNYENILSNGASIATITAIVTDAIDNFVPDGTPVLFTTDHGTFEGGSSITKTTVGGVATANLTSVNSSTTVIATIIATSGSGKDAIGVFFQPAGKPDIDLLETIIVNGNGPAIFSWGYGSINIEGTGEHIATGAVYQSNPGGSINFDNNINMYLDIHLNSVQGITRVTGQSCVPGEIAPYLENMTVYFWDGSIWRAASNQSFIGGCLNVVFDTSTFPSLNDLMGIPLTFGWEMLMPTITTNPATGVNVNSAVLNGAFDFKVYNSGRVQFAYREAGTGTWSFSPWMNVSGAGIFTFPLINLIPGHTYNFKARMSSSNTTVYVTGSSIQGVSQGIPQEEESVLEGQELSFTTLTPLPSSPTPKKTIILPSSKPFNDSSVSPYIKAPAHFSVKNISAQPQLVAANQPVTIFANVVNTGDVQGGFTAELKVNGQIEQTKTGSVTGQMAKPIEFVITKGSPGIYEVEINGQTTSFTVVGEAITNSVPSIVVIQAPPVQTAQSAQQVQSVQPGVIAISVVALLGIIAVLLTLVLRRRFS